MGRYSLEEVRFLLKRSEAALAAAPIESKYAAVRADIYRSGRSLYDMTSVLEDFLAYGFNGKPLLW